MTMTTTATITHTWMPLRDYAIQTGQVLGSARVAAWRALEQRGGVSTDGRWLFERVFPQEPKSTIKCRRI